MSRKRSAPRPFLVMCLSAAVGLGALPLSACAPAPTAAPTPDLGQTRLRIADSAEMVLVPAGEFLMGGADADLKATADEKPAHMVYLDAFWIDRNEVTNAQYTQFLNVLGGYRGACRGHDCLETQVEEEGSHLLYQEGQCVVENGFEAHPVIEVTWYGAQAYCEWAGGRLPTEAEWEKAARGSDGRIYPWGNEPPDCDKAQYSDCGATTAPVGARLAGASPYGALDMAGNVWEWVADWYDLAYYGSSAAQNPRGPDSGTRKVFRGGSWGYPPTFLRTSDRARNRPTYAGFNVGFRCAASAPSLSGEAAPGQ